MNKCRYNLLRIYYIRLGQQSVWCVNTSSAIKAYLNCIIFSLIRVHWCTARQPGDIVHGHQAPSYDAHIIVKYQKNNNSSTKIDFSYLFVVDIPKTGYLCVPRISPGTTGLSREKKNVWSPYPKVYLLLRRLLCKC